MMDCGRPEFDSCDSASATSSTLVITPSSSHDILKRHIQSGAIVHRIQNSNNATRDMSKSPQLQLKRQLQSSMNQSQNVGKGPIQPHVSNLPRRKPRQSSAEALPKESPTLAKPNAVKTLSSASIRTNAARSPSPHSSSSSSSSQPPDPKAYFVDDEPSPSVAGINVKPFTPTTPAQGVGFALPPPKGHIQPHITNMPRRRPRRILPSRNHTSVEQRRLREKEVWEKARCLQEVIKGSGVWIAFWDWERALEESDEEDQSDVSFAEESLRAEQVIQISTREQVDLEDLGDSVVAADGVVDPPKNLLKLFLPLEVVRARDDGVSHLSLEQISLARRFFLKDSSSSTTFSRDSACAPSSSSSSSTPPPTTTSTPSLSRCSSSSISAFASSQSSLYSLSFSSEPKPSKRLLITVPRREYAVDALTLVTLAFFLAGNIPLATPATESCTSSVHDFLNRLCDLEGLDYHWRGALSCDGIEWLDKVLDMGKQESALEV